MTFVNRFLWLSVVFAPTLAAQSPTPIIRLAPPSGQFVVGNEPAALELQDGRVAMTMMRVHAVVILNFSTGRADTIGRGGGGPGEFGVPQGVFPMTNGGFGVVDLGLNRVTLFNRSGVRDSITPVPAGHQAMTVRLHSNATWYSAGAANPSDSQPLLRSVGPGGKRDTIARIHRPRSTITEIGFGTALNLLPEYAPRDLWGSLPDGRIWIARGGDNRIDWIMPDGRMARGQPRDFPRIKTVDADRHKFRGMPAPVAVDTARRAIAPIKAPFQEVIAGADGSLWFWENQPAGYKTERYRVIDSDGKSSFALELPLAHRILAVGHADIYVISMNDDDEMIISRHLRPSRR